MRISDWSSDVCSSDLTSSKGLYKNLPFDPVKDFSALGLVGDTPYIVAVNPSVKAKTLKEFEIGSASCRERVCQDVKISVVAVSLKNKSDYVHLSSRTILYSYYY